MANIIEIPSPGDTIGNQFTLGAMLGKGGYGVVFEALQMGTERKVAIKMLLPRALESEESVLERFQREARLASSLKHPSAVAIYAYGIHKPEENKVGLPYLAMEFLEGVSLQDHLLNQGALRVEEAADILAEALGSLTEAHDKGIIHRDIKPDNIFLHHPHGEKRVVKVLDYGIAMAVSPEWSEENRQRLTETGMVTGTAEYMAPEQAMGGSTYTPALDVYAMGCVGYHLLTGSFPFPGTSAVEIAIKHIYDPIPVLPPHVEETFLAPVLYRAMDKNPDVRYQDASEFAEALRAGRAGETSHPLLAPVVQTLPHPELSSGTYPGAPIHSSKVQQAPPVVQRETRRTSPWPMVALGAITALVLVVGITGFMFYQTRGAPPEITAVQPTTEDKQTQKSPPPSTPPSVAEKNAETPVDAGEKIRGPIADRVRLLTQPPATVKLGPKILGTTPLALERSDLGDAPFRLKLVADKHAPHDMEIDWFQVPPTREISVQLRKNSAATAAKPSSPSSKNKSTTMARTSPRSAKKGTQPPSRTKSNARPASANKTTANAGAAPLEKTPPTANPVPKPAEKAPEVAKNTEPSPSAVPEASANKARDTNVEPNEPVAQKTKKKDEKKQATKPVEKVIAKEPKPKEVKTKEEEDVPHGF